MITSGKEIFLSISKKLINSQGKYLINNQYIIIKEQGFEWKKVANIYLVRHSILAWNNAFCYPKLANNKPDVAREKNGEFLFQYIGVIHMYLGIKSSLRSAVKMMEYWLYSKNHENPIQVEPGLIVVNLGSMDGMTREEISWLFLNFTWCIFSMRTRCKPEIHLRSPWSRFRMSEAAMGILLKLRGENKVISSKGRAIQALINFASGIPSDKMEHILPFNVSMTCEEIDERVRKTPVCR